jgi:hypothetical protein
MQHVSLSEEGWVSTKEAARVLGLCPATIRKLGAAGLIPVLRVSPSRHKYAIGAYLEKIRSEHA